MEKPVTKPSTTVIIVQRGGIVQEVRMWPPGAVSVLEFDWDEIEEGTIESAHRLLGTFTDDVMTLDVTHRRLAVDLLERGWQEVQRIFLEPPTEED